jgi:hypothetical protein
MRVAPPFFGVARNIPTLPENLVVKGLSMYIVAHHIQQSSAAAADWARKTQPEAGPLPESDR